MEALMEWAVTGSYIILGMIVLLIAKLLQDFLTPYRLDEQLTEQDNPALGLSVTGYLTGAVIIFLGAAGGEFSADFDIAELGIGTFATMLARDGGYALGGIVCLNLARWLLDKVMLPRFSTAKEIIEDRNIGMGAVEFGAYIASSLTIAAAIHGEGGGPLTALACFGLGQLALILFARLYQVNTPFDLHKELERDNVAAGVVLGGGLIALGIILWSACHGDFLGWALFLERFAYQAVFGFVLLALMRMFTDRILLPKADLAREIAEDRNLGAAFLEAGLAIAIAGLVVVML